MDEIKGSVRGIDVGPRTGCTHYHSPLDIIAIRMKCCGEYYACKDCHEALADHPIQVWPRAEWDQKAILCGACRTELTIAAYLASAYHCPDCGAAFNPGCARHAHFYFEAPAGENP